ncbi:hypothetical protein CLU86_1453 [Acidovorax sp. 62]|uniref:hypothetical protein n=1 Tax=Acidovorax sp. 62 TaxID=2035203 RepID=UPI000C69DEE3|nr:hypothetical protein [Acidovorax sp. 62]PIF90564.1 hypothetical protein CLU86_1453 [Acidovorax sp. 62]
MPNFKTASDEKSPQKNYLKIIHDAKKSGRVGKIFAAFNSVAKSDKLHSFIPSKFHIPESLYTSPVVFAKNIIGELIWGSIVLHAQAEEINQYIFLKRSIEPLILNSEWSKALALISEFELKNGTAATIKELSIAITQQADGTAKQVAYSRKLEAKGTGNVFPLFVRFASERNEDRLTLSGFRRNFREIENQPSVPPLASAVIHWHCLHQLPKDEEILSQLLSFEESGSLYDYYEAYIAIATLLATRSNLDIRIAVKNSLQRLLDINDLRIINLSNLLNENFSAKNGSLAAHRLIHSLIYRIESENINSPIVEAVSNLLSDRKHPDSDIRRSVHKLAANFYHLDLFQAVFCHLEHKTSIACLEQAVAPGLALLAPETSLRSLFSYSYKIAENRLIKFGTSIHAVARKYFSDEHGNIASPDVVLLCGISFAKHGKIDELIDLIETTRINAIDRSHLLLVGIAACHEHGRHIDLLPFALEVSSIRLDALSLVPIVKSLESILPGRLDGRSAALFSIVASRVLLIEESDRLEDKLMVASEVAFFHHRSKPDCIHDGDSSIQLWICFLRDVLVVQNMLLIDDVNSLRDALNLRVEILRNLVEIDSDNRAIYLEEVRDIAFNLSVDEGIRQVNTSRLNVNIHGLTKWANDHCLDDYERYKELVIGEANVGDLPVKLTAGSGSILDKFAVIPLGAADDQLVKLLGRIRNAYLSDPRNGLDAYISLRVRHGSLSGTLSRGLDIRQLLLLQKGESGQFEPPNYWIGRLGLNPVQAAELTIEFTKFTEKFRESIDDLLRNRLHVKNDRNPQGEITAEITDWFVKGLKIDILDGMSFDTFISTVFISYKNAVSSYLEKLRKYLKSDFLSNSVEALELLSSNVEKAVCDVQKQSQLNDAITSARLDLQASVRIVCGWLEIAQKEDLAQLYTLKQASEIGINYTKQVRNEFQPRISINGVNDSFRLTGASLIVVVDILFIMLDNVFKHAGLPNERTISLNFDFSEEHLIKIQMRNDLARHVDHHEVLLGFEAARNLISNDIEKKLTEENRSGLPKLRRLVAQDRSDALAFDLAEGVVEINALVGYSSLELGT